MSDLLLDDIDRPIRWIESNEKGYIRIHPFATPFTEPKIKPMLGRRIFCGNGISAMLWLGDKGSFALSEAAEDITRAQYASVSIISKGLFRMTAYPVGSGPWPLLTPGMICSEVSGDFIKGLYCYEALEDDSREICLGGVDSKGYLDYGKFVYGKVLSGVVTVRKGSVLVVATGEVDVFKLGVQQSPAFISAEKNDLEVQLKGEGMWIARG